MKNILTKKSRIFLKRATRNDAAEILAIETSAAKNKTYAAMTSLAEVTKCLKNQVVFFIKKGTQTIGSINYQLRGNERAQVRSLVILPAFQGHGYGQKAVALILKKVKKYKRVHLTVHPHNTRAILLYLSLGFIIETWKNNYFGDGQPRLIMAWKHRGL